MFLLCLSDFYRRDRGFTSLIVFGKVFAERQLPEVKAVKKHMSRGYGYDGQWYAQLAVRPNPWDPELQTALDSSWYRSIRILPSLVAAGLGFGSPARAIHIYALQYPVLWLVIAGLLLHWFPPGTLWDFVAWFGCLFSAGTMVATLRALPDLWAFALLIVGARLLDAGRERWAAGVLGLATLAKEVSLLNAVAFVKRIPRARADFRSMLPNLALATFPGVLWMLALRVFGSAPRVGEGNFGWPFTGYLERVWQTFANAPDRRLWQTQALVSVVVALGVQAGFFLLRWRPADWRWRVGAAQVFLFALVGTAVWAGYPPATPRIVLPMVFCFNLLVPRTLKYWPVLVLGNLSVVSGLFLLVRQAG